MVRDYKADILIAGGRNMYTALKARIPFLDINQEREFGYEGYQGMLELVRQLALTIESPVWSAVRAPAPWKAASVKAAGAGVSSRIITDHRRLDMAEILKRNKAMSVNPLKASQPMGGSLACLGFDRAMPMLHGSQGCTAFAKVFFVRHFREPIPLQTTAMDQASSVLGADENVIEGIKIIAEKSNPALIMVLTTGLAETRAPMCIAMSANSGKNTQNMSMLRSSRSIPRILPVAWKPVMPPLFMN